MRILILGAGGPYRTEASLARAATALGLEAAVVDALGWRRRLGRWAGRVVRWQADRFAPDFVLCTRHAAAAGLDVVASVVRGRNSAFWYFDAAPLPERIAALARLARRSFATYGFQVEALRAAGAAEAHFLPQGFDPAVDRPAATAPPRYRCDLSFVGSGQYPRRHAILLALARVGRLQIRGPHWHAAPAGLPIAGGPVRGPDLGRVVRGAALSIGADALPGQRAERAGGTSNRLWRVLAARGCLLTERVAGLERFVTPGQEVLCYDSVEEAVALAEAALADPDRRAGIARAGWARARAEHSYAHRLTRLLAGQGYTST